eukprot:gene8767-6168_t
MLQVPSSWPCAAFPCAVVALTLTAAVPTRRTTPTNSPATTGNHFFLLCRILPASAAHTSYTIEPVVALPDVAAAQRFVSQDCSMVERHSVLVRQAAGDTHGGLSAYMYVVPPAAPDPPCASSLHLNPAAEGWRAAELLIHCPSVVYSTKTITVSGLRRHARMTPVSVGTALMGRYVAVGAEIRLHCSGRGGPASYTVTEMELKGSGYRGVALVGTSCRVHLNDRPPVAINTRQFQTNAPLGLEGPTAQLQSLFTQAAQWPLHDTVHGAVVRGPHGCGASTTVRYVSHWAQRCLQAQVIAWEPGAGVSPAYLLNHVASRARLLVLLIREASAVFPHAEPELAQLTLRTLRREVGLVQAGAPPELRVAVLAVAHDYGSQCATAVMETLFTNHILVTMPDAEARALLLAGGAKRTVVAREDSIKGEAVAADPAPWRALALELVGRTRREVLEEAERRQLAGGSGDAVMTAPVRQAVRWDAIGGLEEVKRELQQALVMPQRHPAAFQRFHLSAPSGVLLYGPPGCAKTTLVKALCSEGIFSLLYLDSASVMSAYVGESERLLRDTFRRAAQQAPCIIFFDEVEVLGAARESSSGGSSQKDARLVSTVLMEMDGFASSAAGRGVCFVGATNAPHLIDSALLRPGRLDRLLYVGLPECSDRVRILKLFLGKTAANIPKLAEATEGFSGADLQALCTQSLLELLTADGDAEPEDKLQCAEHMDAFLSAKAAAFPRTPFDTTALKRFGDLHRAKS